MENPDLVLQETGSRPTYSRLNYVPSGDTLRRDAISSSDLDFKRNTFIANTPNQCPYQVPLLTHCGFQDVVQTTF